MSDVFDRIATSAPFNKTAARVVGKGTHYEPEVQFANHWHNDAPPALRPVPKVDTTEGMVGKKFGRLTVIGLARDYNPKKGARWVVRCICGDYEVRMARAINNPENANDMCQKCRHWHRAKESYEREGSKPLQYFIDQHNGVASCVNETTTTATTVEGQDRS